MLELVNEFSKVRDIRQNIQKSTVFLYVSNEKSEIKINNLILFIITSKY